ncbi:MAG: efflux RND transporter permease subunit [Pseudobdellovibrionaceae bacterium]
MTALVAIFGFLPMMLSNSIGAEVQRPLRVEKCLRFLH